MKNIKIAKQLIKLAKSLIADDESSNYFDNVIANVEFDGFTKNNEDDSVTFIYNNDETEGSYIVFEKEENGYTVFIDSEPIKEISKNTCEEAFEDLKKHINTYIKSFDTFLKKQEELNQQETYENLGTYKINKSISKENLIKITFIPSLNDKKIIEKSIKEIIEDFQNQLFKIKQNHNDKNQILVMFMSTSDINYIENTLNDFGWSK